MATSRVTTWTELTAVAGTESLAIDDGANKRVTPSTIRGYSELKHGEISVVTADGNVSYTQCVADGATDNRTAIAAVMATAIANMPAVVTFGIGDFGIFGGIEIKPAQGERGLFVRGQGPELTKITFVKNAALTSAQYIAFKVIPAVTPSPADTYSQYVEHIYFEGIGFLDKYPTVHAGAEESHAISMQYVIEASITNCHAEDIGDEAFNYTFVQSGVMDRVNCVNVPSTGSGGGALTVQHGCEDISISNCQLQGSQTKGTISTVTGGYGINLEHTAGFAFDTRNIAISNCNVRDFGNSAIKITSSNAGATQSNITIANNNLSNCTTGVTKSGAEVVKNVTIVGNTMTDMQGTNSYGIRFPSGRAFTTDVIICDNVVANCTTGGMELNITSALLSNNIFSDCERGIYIFDGVDINIASGVFNRCGGALKEEIEDISSTSTTRVANVTIDGSLATSAHVKGVHSLSDSTIKNSAQTTQRQNGIYDVNHISGCDLDVGITQASVTGIRGSIANNTIDYFDGGGSGTGAAINLNLDNDEWLISGNRIDVSTSTNNQQCLKIPTGAVDTLVIGNHFKSKTAGVANSVSDSGTGTKADFTNNNFTS